MMPSIRRRAALVYVLFAVLPAAVVIGLLLYGDRPGPTSAPAQSAEALWQDDVVSVLLAALVVVVVSYGFGTLAERVGQPRVIGEIGAGLLLGPSVFGAFLPAGYAAMFTPGVLAALEVLAQFGVIFFMFLVGAELRFSLLRGSGSRAVVLGHTGIAVPFLLGVLLAMGPLAAYRPAGTSAAAFEVFCGVAFSVTAFPVLARIVASHRLGHTRLGALSLATAGASDVTAWCVLAIVVAVAGQDSPVSVVGTVALSAAFCALMWLVVRPLLARLLTKAAGNRQLVTIVAIVTVLLATVTTEAIGIGSIFGAFAAGAVMPRGTRATSEAIDQLTVPATWLLLPMFFALVGLQTDLTALSGDAVSVMVLVIVVAIAGKLLGVWVPGMLLRLPKGWPGALGVLMNCRGLTEIVVLQIGLSLGVLSTQLFTVFVVMALVTTAMTGPALTPLLRRTVLDDPPLPHLEHTAAA